MICIKDANENWHTAHSISMFYVSGSSIYFETLDGQTSNRLEAFKSNEEAKEQLDKFVKAIGRVVYYKKEEDSNGIMVSVQ